MFDVAAAEYLYRGDAEVALALLASQGIPAYISAEDEGGLNPGFFSEYRVLVMVKEEQLGEARALLGVGAILSVPLEVRTAMEAHSAWAHPNEACGLLAGRDEAVEMVFCLNNRVASPTRYTIDPREYFGAMRFAERCGWEIIGAWHSHPDGDAVLSLTDIELAPGGAWITAVVGSDELGSRPIRAYRTAGSRVAELAVLVELPDGEVA